MADITSTRSVVAQMPRRVDLDQIERAISAPLEQAPEIDSHMTAEGVLRQHEAAARAVESMAGEVNQSATGLQASLDECGATMRALEEAANSIRETGKRRALQVEDVNARLQEIRTMCAAFKEKLGS